MVRAALILCMLTSAAIAADAVVATRLPIPNGGMDAGTDVPDGWTVRWTGKGKLKAVRDTTVFRSGPASLRVDTVGGGAHGTAGCSTPCTPGTTVELSGWIKGTDRCVVTLFCQLYRDDWTCSQPIKLGIHNAASGPFWSEGHGTVPIPPGFTSITMGIIVEGQGSAWLDDMRNLADVPPEPAR